MEGGIFKRTIFTAFALNRTVLVYPFAYLNANAILALSHDTGALENSSYLLIILIALTILLYLLLLILQFNIGWLPLISIKHYPWSSQSQKELLIREILKIIAVVQLSFTPSLRSQQVAFGIYYFILLLSTLYSHFYRVRYLSFRIDQINFYGGCLVSSINFICFIRIAFHIQITEILIFLPIMTFVVATMSRRIFTKKTMQMISNLKSASRLSGKDIQVLLLEAVNMIERQSELDLTYIREIAQVHTIKCLDEDCYCKKQYEIMIKPHRKNLPPAKQFKEQTNLNRRSDSLKLNTRTSHWLEDASARVDTKRLVNFQSNGEFQSLVNFDEIGSAEPKLVLDSNQVSLIPIPEEDHHQIEGLAQKQIYPYAAEFLTFSFDTNIEVQGLQVSDFFREVFEIENSNQKLIHQPFDKNQVEGENPQQKDEPSNNPRLDSTLKSQPNMNMTQAQQQSDLIKQNTLEKPKKKLKFKTKQEALKFIFTKIIESILKDIDGNNFTLNSLLKDINHQLVFVSFISTYLNKNFQAIFQLLRINQQKEKLGFFERVRFASMEQLILEEALYQNRQQSNGLDYSFFIDGNQQQLELDEIYSGCTNDIIQFWRGFKSEEINIPNQMKLGRKISSNVLLMKGLTKKLEENQQIKKDFVKYQIYALFHLELLHDPMTSSQMAQYIKNQLLLRNKNNKFIAQLSGSGGQPLLLQNNINDIGVSIVSAWAGMRNSWEFMYGNKAFCDLFKIQENNLAGKQINSIMPYSYSLFHDHLIRKFYIDGHPRILGKLRIVMAKNLLGYLFPVQLRINFYYHHKFSYSFIVQAEKVKTFNLFNEDTQKVNVEDCMFFITDTDLNISDFSENFLSLSGQTQQRMDLYEEQAGRKESMANFIQDINSIIYDEKQDKTILQKANCGLANRLMQMSKFNPALDHFDHNQQFPCLLNYFQEIYLTQNDEQKVHIFLILPLSKHPEYEFMMPGQKSVGFSIDKASSNFLKRGHTMLGSNLQGLNSNNHIGENHQENSNDWTEEGLDLSSISSTNSSESSNLLQSHYAKNLLFQNKAPRLLKINTAIILSVFVGFLIVSIYNLAAFLDKWSAIADRLYVISLISQRNSNLRSALLSIKMMQGIALDPKTQNISNVLPQNVSRIDFYRQNLLDSLGIVRSQADLFNQFIGVNSDYIGYNMEFEGFRFLTEEGFLYNISVPYKQATKLLASYAQNISVDQLVFEKPDLNITNYCRNYSAILQSPSAIGNRKLTELERSLFTISENGMYTMQELGWRQYLLLRDSAYQQTLTSKTVLSVTTFVSISVVTMLCLLIYPLLAKVYNRVYTSIKFFNDLDKELYSKCLEKALAFKKQLRQKIGRQQSQSNQMERYDMMEAKERETQKQQIDLKASTTRQEKLESKSSRRNKSGRNDSKRSIFEDENSNRGLQQDEELDSSKNVKLTKGIKDKITDFIVGDKINSKNQKSIEKQKDLKKQQGREKRRSKYLEQYNRSGKANYLEDIMEEEEKEEGESSRSQSEDSSRHEKQKRHTQRNSKRYQGSKGSHRYDKHPIDASQSNRQRVFYLQLNKIIIQSKIKLFALLVLILCYLNSSLLVSYIQSQDVFENDSKSIDSLQMYFFREECAYNLILFMREKAIRNYSITINIYDTPDTFKDLPAVYNYVERCQQNENLLYAQRNSMPPYYDISKGKLLEMETSEACNITYQDTEPSKVKGCETALNSILQKGQSSAIIYLITLVQQLNINFDSSVTNTKSVLVSFLQNKYLNEFTDFTFLYLKQTLDKVQILAQASSVDYFSQAKGFYLLAFGMFISFTILIVVAIGSIIYLKVKRLMLQMQNLLCLVPLEDILPHQRQKLESFLNK